MNITDEAVEAAHIAANQKANLHTYVSERSVRAYVSEMSVRAALEAALPHLSQRAVRAETSGPYEARICEGMPAEVCDFGVVSLSEGREVCRAWREQDARAIAAALSPAPIGVTDEMVERLRAERDEALEAENEAKDCFWAIYPDWMDMKGHGITTEAARTLLADRAEATEARNAELVKALEVSRQVLAKLLSAGHNSPTSTPEEIDAAFWHVDAALGGQGNEA